MLSSFVNSETHTNLPKHSSPSYRNVEIILKSSNKLRGIVVLLQIISLAVETSVSLAGNKDIIS